MELTGLIVGLGNPGKDYEETRHNFGFMALDALVVLCQDYGSVSTLSGKNDPFILLRANISKGPLAGQAWLFAKPLTYMNKSGEAVQRILAYYRLLPQQTLVMHDELDLPLGRIRFKQGGGNAGHNGLKSLQQHLGTPDFYRLRLGIGRPTYPDTASYVLSRFTSAEAPLLQTVMPAILEGALLFMRKEYTQAQRYCNSFT